MIRSIRRGALAFGSVLCFSLAGAAIAQPAPPPPDNASAEAPRHHERDPAAREADHARRLTEVLQLRQDQDGALHAYLEAMHPRGDRDEGARHEHGDNDEALSTPQRLDHMLAHFDEMRAKMVTRVEATKVFYAQLSPPQQRAFDAMGPGFGHHEHGDHEHGGHDDGDHQHGDHGDHGPDHDSGDSPHG